MDAKIDKTLNFSVLLLGMLLCGCLSIYFGKELQWDLAGYHFYNPFAYLHHRLPTQDYWPPSALQQYITPTLDFLTYFLITHCSPMLTEFLLGSLHGVNFFLIYLIARQLLVLPIPGINWQRGIAIVCALVGMYAATVFTGIGAFFNDNTVSIFVLGFVLLQAQVLRSYTEATIFPTIKISIASLLLGIAVGAKLTAGIYAVAALASLLLLNIPMKIKFKMLGFTFLGVVLGILVASGYWMYFLWDHYQNPFFPLFNGIFHSPYLPELNWAEHRYVPTSWWDALLFPIKSVRPLATSEFYFKDLRFLLAYVVLIGFLLVSLARRHLGILKNPELRWFCLFFVIAYSVWELNFAIMRYLAVLQMLAPLFIVMLVFASCKHFTVCISILILLLDFQLISFKSDDMERMKEFGQDYFNVTLPAEVKQIPAATVLLAYSDFARETTPKPNQYLIPYFPPAWRFSGISFHAGKYIIPDGVREFVAKDAKPVFFLAPMRFMQQMYLAGLAMHLRASGPCNMINSDRQKVSEEIVLLCPVAAF